MIFSFDSIKVNLKYDCFKAAFSRGSKLLNFACSHLYHVSQNTVLFGDRTYTAIKYNWRQIEHRWDYHPLSSLLHTIHWFLIFIRKCVHTIIYRWEDLIRKMFAFFVRGSSFCLFVAACINSFLSQFCERKSKIEFHVLPFSCLFPRSPVTHFFHGFGKRMWNNMLAQVIRLLFDIAHRMLRVEHWWFNTATSLQLVTVVQ